EEIGARIFSWMTWTGRISSRPWPTRVKRLVGRLMLLPIKRIAAHVHLETSKAQISGSTSGWRRHPRLTHHKHNSGFEGTRTMLWAEPFPELYLVISQIPAIPDFH